MGTTWNDTPSADRVHIAFFGKMNSGKSSLVNALAGQQISIVSKIGGTTTDLVKKPMEIHGIGACVLVDTAGFDDTGALGGSRVALAKQAAKQADLAVLVFSGEQEKAGLKFLTFQRKNHIAAKGRYHILRHFIRLLNQIICLINFPFCVIRRINTACVYKYVKYKNCAYPQSEQCQKHNQYISHKDSAQCSSFSHLYPIPQTVFMGIQL